MEFVHVVSCIIFLLTVTASPEIPSKGKHTHMGDKSQTALEDTDMPRFAEPVANVTVSAGRDALLACVVENLKGYKVAWVRVDTQTILSIHHNVISQNNRISLTYNDHRSWYLHIKEVEESDRGWYMCQVNTDPMRSRKGYLQVVVPPMIIEGMTSNDLVVREGLNVTLMCKARGYPEPYVMWRREDGEEMLIGGEHVNVVDGELLHITKVSRLHMAAYLCVASNGVPPSISKRVHLRVQFPPMLSIPNQLEGAYVGQDVVLECHTEAYPASINYWTTERGDMIISDTSRAGDKYETTSTVNGYTKYMKLKIRNVGPNDFGTYRCVAKNSLGETDGNIKLDEMPAPTTAILSEMAMLNRSLDGKRRNKNKLDSNSLPDYGVEEWRDGAGNAGDNNQAPMRNPPDAYHNSAGALAQHNLVGVIIQAIKMQSLKIFKLLTNLLQTLNECETIICPRNNNIKTTATGTMPATVRRTAATIKAIRKTIEKYVHKIQKFTAGLVASFQKRIKSTVIIIPKQWVQQQKKQKPQDHATQSSYLRKTPFIENEFKAFKHFTTQETHISRLEKRNKIWNRKFKRIPLCYLRDKKKMTLHKQLQPQQQYQEENFNFMSTAQVNDFENHMKQEEILHKFNTIYLTHIFHKITDNNNNNNNKFYAINKQSNFYGAAIFYGLIILLLIFLFIFLIKKFLKKSSKNPKVCKIFLSQQLLLLLVQEHLFTAIDIIVKNILYLVSITLKILTSSYRLLSFNFKVTPSKRQRSSSSMASTTSVCLTDSSFIATSKNPTHCSILLFCR